MFLLVLTLACNRGTARLDNNCDCDERSPATSGDDTSTGDARDSVGETGTADDTATGGQAAGSDGWLTYTVICADEDTVAGEGYSAEVDIGVVPPMLVAQVWADLDPVEVEAGSCRSALRQAMPYGSGADLSYTIEADGTMLLGCAKYGDGYHPDWCPGYDGWAPISYTIHVLPMNSAAR